MAFTFDILHDDEDFVVIDKPEGFHVHRPESRQVRADRSLIVLHQLRDQLGKYVYPVHRLDVPTSGCLVMAFSADAAANFAEQLQQKQFQKTYLGVVRGWPPVEFEVDVPLASEDKTKMMESLSRVKRLKTVEFEGAMPTSKHTASRYALVQLEPVTGRFHQLRRHLNHASYPLIGDVGHGDRHQNRYFAGRFGIPGLCLRSTEVSFWHPADPTRRISVSAPATPKWRQLLALFEPPPIP